MATKTAVRKKAGRGDVDAYKGVRDEAFKPVSERKVMIQGRGGKLRPVRRYSLAEKDVVALRKASKSEGFKVPYREGGIYHAATQALVNLGVNKSHSYSAVRAEVQKILSKLERNGRNAWDMFANRKPRNKKTGKDVNGRLLQTFQILQRITGFHPYGEKLRQLGACIDILDSGQEMPNLRLHTGFANYNVVKPVNELKRSRKSKASKSKKTAGKSKSKRRPRKK